MRKRKYEPEPLSGTWVCDNCFSAMEVTKDSYNRWRIHCPNCGTEWFVDDDNEYINE